MLGQVQDRVQGQDWDVDLINFDMPLKVCKSKMGSNSRVGDIWCS